MQKTARIGRSNRRRGFTIVELLVVIVIIGVLATITFVVYKGVVKSATGATITSDANKVSKALAMYQVEKDGYPDDIGYGSDCVEDDTSLCVDLSPNNRLDYFDEEDSYDFLYCLYNEIYMEELGGCMPRVDPSLPPDEKPEPSNPEIKPFTDPDPEECPTNFIPVPGSVRYGQPAFCVMKYEGKVIDEKAVSKPDGMPTTNISYDYASLIAEQTCDGCHVMTNREWMTLARDVISQPDNWVSGKVGDGVMYKGNSVGRSTGQLAASSDDNEGYFGLIPDQYEEREKRTLKLSNNSVIWDLAGNVQEMTKGHRNGSGDLFFDTPCDRPLSACQMGSSEKMWDQIEPLLPTVTASLDISPYPKDMGITSVTNPSAYNQGLGDFSYPDIDKYLDKNSNIFIRGGGYLSDMSGGLLSLRFSYGPGSSTVGFRVAK